jgi:homoserine kinase
VLPKTVPLQTLVSNVASASMIVSGFAKSDVALIGAGMSDLAVEQARKAMIPGYDAVRKAAIEAGAAGVCISGAGPSMLAVLDTERAQAAHVLDAMIEGFGSADAEAEGFVTGAGKGAARV